MRLVNEASRGSGDETSERGLAEGLGMRLVNEGSIVNPR